MSDEEQKSGNQTNKPIDDTDEKIANFLAKSKRRKLGQAPRAGLSKSEEPNEDEAKSPPKRDPIVQQEPKKKFKKKLEKSPEKANTNKEQKADKPVATELRVPKYETPREPFFQAYEDHPPVEEPLTTSVETAQTHPVEIVEAVEVNEPPKAHLDPEAHLDAPRLDDLRADPSQRPFEYAPQSEQVETASPVEQAEMEEQSPPKRLPEQQPEPQPERHPEHEYVPEDIQQSVAGKKEVEERPSTFTPKNEPRRSLWSVLKSFYKSLGILVFFAAILIVAVSFSKPWLMTWLKDEPPAITLPSIANLKAMPRDERLKLRNSAIRLAPFRPKHLASDPIPFEGGRPIELEHFRLRSVGDGVKVSGKLRLYEMPDKRQFLRLTDFEMTAGYDLHVLLAVDSYPTNKSELDQQGYVDLATLKGENGPQNYLLPKTFDLSDFGSFVIYDSLFEIVYTVSKLQK